jgi:hypothetical protein
MSTDKHTHPENIVNMIYFDEIKFLSASQSLNVPSDCLRMYADHEGAKGEFFDLAIVLKEAQADTADFLSGTKKLSPRSIFLQGHLGSTQRFEWSRREGVKGMFFSTVMLDIG